MRRAAWLVFGVSAVVRLILLLQLRASSPTFDFPEGGDSILYDRLASGAGEPLRAYFHSPLYIWFLTALYKCFGRDLFAVRVVQHLIGAGAAVLVHHVTRRLFRMPAIALYAGLLAGVLGPVAFYEAQIGIDALMPALVVGCAAVFVTSARTKRPVHLLGLGIAVGVSALGRGVTLVWIPVLLVWILRWRAPRARRMRGGLALCLGLALTVLPVTIRNYRVERDFVLITANAGLNFYIGNHPAANGAYVAPQGLSFRAGDPADDFEGFRAAQESVGHPLRSSEVSAWWARRAWRFVFDAKRDAAKLALTKLHLLVDDYEYPQLHDYGAYKTVAPILRYLPSAAFATVPGVLGLGHVLLRSRRTTRARRTYALMTLAFAVSFVPFFVVGRYRAPWLILLAPFAAYAFARVASWVRARKLGPVVRFAIVFGALVFLTTRRWVYQPSEAVQLMSFARASLHEPSPESTTKAIRWAKRAIASDPHSDEGYALIGRLHVDAHDEDAAEAILAIGARECPRSPAILRELGMLYLRAGRFEEAVTALDGSLRAAPGERETWTALARALSALGRTDDAEAAARSARVLE